MEVNLTKITETVEGWPVKNLVWRPMDNIYTGLVKDEYANQNLNDGFISGQWRRNGTPTNSIRGRSEFTIKFD